ncbi:ABC transporter ATP-binding protein [Pseudomonas syringae pv. actinidiae ICMP 19101]|nr:ABC transporter ATP-binding protein [Pseudomonas syringae pv. actinidiae ICMP 19101]
MAPRPRVLLLDEPLAALDAQLRERLRSELDQLLRGLGITSVFVTHDQGEAMALGLNAFSVVARTSSGLTVSGGELPWNGAEMPGTVYCRPEHLRLVPGHGHLQGRLVGQFFQGAQSRLLVDVGGPQPLLVDSTDNVIYPANAAIGLSVELQQLFTLHS